MDLFSLPEVVLQGILLPYLEWKDLLSLRLVCQAGKQVVQNYLKVYNSAAPEIEIGTRDDEQGRSLEAFLKMGVYSSRIFLNNRSGAGAGFYENDEDGTIGRFLEEHGAKVKHLRVNYWTLYSTGMEKQFLEALVNLEKFDVGNFTMSPWQDELESKDIVPTGFRNLSILKLNQPLDMDLSEVIANANKLLTSCPDLKVLSLPCFQSLELKISCDGTIAAGEEVVNARTMFSFRLSSNIVQNESRTNYRLQFTTTCLGVPELDSLVGSCPNLKKLAITNWIGTNEQLARLWKALRGFPLEEIVFANCGKLEDAAFIGDNTARPVFLGLARNLKRLTLRDLDQMPGLTDTLFTAVICNLGITHLKITSNQPVRSITEAGIVSLLNGRCSFMSTIQRFFFTGWSLENVSHVRFQQLAREFRILQLVQTMRNKEKRHFDFRPTLGFVFVTSSYPVAMDYARGTTYPLISVWNQKYLRLLDV